MQNPGNSIEILASVKQKWILFDEDRGWRKLTGLVERRSVEITNKVAKWIKAISRNNCIIMWRIYARRKSTYKVPHASTCGKYWRYLTCSGFISFRDPYMAGNLRTGSRLKIHNYLSPLWNHVVELRNHDDSWSGSTIFLNIKCDFFPFFFFFLYLTCQ